MTISLEKSLVEATVAKKRYCSLFILASFFLLILLIIVYKNTVLDYAVLANVKINRSDNTNQMIFSFDVLKAGRVDFNYGIASLTDIKQVAEGDGFNWTWDAQGKTEISIRSRKLVLPHWDKEVFVF